MSDLHSSSSWATSTLPEPSSLSTPPLLRPVAVPPPCASSASPESSSLMHSSPSKPQLHCEDGTSHDQPALQQSYERDCTSSCQGRSKPVLISTPAMAPSPERLISLQQHLQHADIGREAAMQSFILDRFLPAAKAMATDRDRALYVAAKRDAREQPIRPKQSVSLPRMYIPNSRTAPWLQASVRSSSTSSVPKGAPWSSPLSQEGGRLEYSDDEDPIKSNGFFCVGLKTAISRVHRVVHPSMSRNKERAALSSTPDADAEVDVFPKVRISPRARQMQWNGHITASYTSSSTSPTADNAVQGSASRFAAPHRNSLPQSCVGGDGKPSGSPVSLDGALILNRCSSPQPDQSYAGCLSDRRSASDHRDGMAESPGGSRVEDASPAQNSRSCITHDESTSDITTRASSEGSTVRCTAAEISKNGADSCDDDDEQFHDALDSWSSIAAASLICPSLNAWSSNAGAPLTCPPPNCPAEVTESTRKWDSDKDGAVDDDSYGGTPHTFDTGGISGCITKSEGLVEYDPEPREAGESKEPGQSHGGSSASAGSADGADGNQKHGELGEALENQGQEGSSHASNDTCSANPTSPASVLLLPIRRSRTPASRQKSCASPPKLGWPLGMSGFQVGLKKPSPPEETDMAGLVPTSTESSGPSSPPVLSSPTGSWLGKAMAMNASKPSALATLQQKQKAMPARMKPEFTPSDRKKSVKWEDVVKGSQMDPEQFSFAEDLRHRHPSNRNVLRPLRL